MFAFYREKCAKQWRMISGNIIGKSDNWRIFFVEISNCNDNARGKVLV